MYTYVLIAERNKKKFTITLIGEWLEELAKHIKELMSLKKDFACSEEEDHIKMVLAINGLQVEYKFPAILEVFLVCSLKEIEGICYKFLRANPKSGKISGEIDSLREAD